MFNTCLVPLLVIHRFKTEMAKETNKEEDRSTKFNCIICLSSPVSSSLLLQNFHLTIAWSVEIRYNRSNKVYRCTEQPNHDDLSSFYDTTCVYFVLINTRYCQRHHVTKKVSDVWKKRTGFSSHRFYTAFYVHTRQVRISDREKVRSNYRTNAAEQVYEREG